VNIESFREYCLLKKGVTEEFPFDNNTLVFKVMGKMFALTDVELFSGVNLKCDPDEAVELREKYDFIRPAFHMNKKHWVTVTMEGAPADRLLKALIDNSYALVIAKLTKSEKLRLNT
jgi:predicted DNA-binding protein (MmcQ/YjbR family)